MLKNLPKINLQIKNPLKNLSKKKKILLAAAAVIVIAAIAVVASFTSKRSQMKETMETAFVTETAKIERQTLTNSISATGTVESAETKTVNTSIKDIEVVAVYVKEGDYVEEGTVICEFDASDYEEALAEAQHNAAINEQLDALNDASSTYEDSVESAFDSLKDVSTSKDEAAADYDEAASELSSAKSSLSSASSALQTAKANYDAIADELAVTPSALVTYETNYKTELRALADAQVKLAEAEEALAKASENDSNYAALEKDVTDAIAAVTDADDRVNEKKAKYDTAATRYNELLAIEAAYKTAQSNYNSAQSSVSEAERTLEQAEAALEQAEDRLDSAWENYDNTVEKADEQAAKAALEDQLITESQEEKAMNEYTELIDDCVVKATMSGVITSLNVTEGNVFEGGDVYTIQDNEHFIVSSAVDEYDISSIEKGMSAYIKTDATGDVEMTGEVTYVAIAPAGNGAMGAISNSASYTIKVTIDEADANLRAGMTAKISIALEESADTLTVPYDAVTTGPDGNSTITIDADGEKKTITVKTGLETDYYTEIISNEISEGMTVYLTTPMIKSGSGGDEDDRNALDGLLNGITGGGGMPSGGDGMPSGGGGRPSGGGERPSGGGGSMPSGGGPGGF